MSANNSSPQANRTLTVEFLFDNTRERDIVHNSILENDFLALDSEIGAVTVLGTSTGNGFYKKYSDPPQEQPQPTYSRQAVITEKWEPKLNEEYFAITRDNNIIPCINYHLSELSRHSSQGFIFAPTLELAEEIVQIRKGEWLPKKGDMVYCDIKECYYFNGKKTGHDYTATSNYSHHNFPSAKQRQAFIEKNKPKEIFTCKICSTEWHDRDLNCSQCELLRCEPKEESAEMQIERLARFIENNCPHEPSKLEGAVDAAIRLLTPQKTVTPQSQPSPYSDRVTDGFSDIRIPTVNADNLTIADLVRAISAYNRQQALEYGEWNEKGAQG